MSEQNNQAGGQEPSASPAALTDAQIGDAIERVIGFRDLKNGDLSLAAELLAAQPAEPAPTVPEGILDALRFYANGSHFTMHDSSAWDTVSGEPQNFYEDESNTATVEDGSIAKLALQGKFCPDTEYQEPAVDGEVYGAAPAEPARADRQGVALSEEVWGVRIGDSDRWAYTNSESDADFWGKQSGLKYEKRRYVRASSSLANTPDIKAMVDRFLGWKLPRDFSPDCGVSFMPVRHGDIISWPIGTNLLSADQARQMFEFVLAAQPAADAPIIRGLTEADIAEIEQAVEREANNSVMALVLRYALTYRKAYENLVESEDAAEPPHPGRQGVALSDAEAETIVQRTEVAVGMNRHAWDCIDAKEIVRAILSRASSSRAELFSAEQKQKMVKSAAEHGMDLGGQPVAYEFHNKETGHAIVDYSRHTHVGHLTAEAGYEARPLVYSSSRAEVEREGARDMLATLVDMYFDAKFNPPESRAYVDGAFGKQMDEASVWLAAAEVPNGGKRDA